MRLLYEPLTDIPVGFQEVEYIQSNGTQYIDVGLKANGNTGLDIVFSNSITSDLPVLGSRTSWSSNAFSINWANGKYAFNYGNYSNSTNLTTDVPIDTNKHTATIRKGGICTFDNWSYTFGDYTFTTPNNIILFALDNNGTIVFTQANINIYMCKIYNGNVLVRDFVPCLDNNNVPCMYDKVEGKAYYNAGTGTFSYGRKIIPVEYLRNTGTQYINTGYKPNNNTRVQSKFKMNETTSNFSWFFLSRNQTVAGDGFGFGTDGSGNITSDYNNRVSANVKLVSDTEYTLDKNKNVCKYNNSTITNTESSFTINSNLCIWALNDNNNINYSLGTKSDVYYFKIYDNDILVRDFVPAKDENNIGFMFDKATHTIYDNAGTGSFVVGKTSKKKKLRLLRDKNKRVPAGFKEVEYIQSSGTQYINTGFIPTGNTGIDMRFLITGRGSGGNDSNIIMSGGDSANYRCGFGYRSSSDTTYGHTLQVSGICATGNSWENYAMTINVPHTVLYNYDNQKKCYLDGTLVRENIPYGTATVTYPLFIFSSNMNGTSWRTSSFKLYYCKIVDNGVLVRDFIPCLDSNNVPCLWDTVTKQAYYNQGTGDFTYGSQIIPVKYLESTGTQYIDTGVILTNNHSVEIDYQLTSASQNRKGIFGGLTTSRYGALLSPSNNYLEFGYGSSNIWYQTGLPDTNRHTMYQKKNELYFDGVLINTFTADTFTQTATSPLGNFNYTNYNPATAKYYSSKWWDGDTLVRDYIPVKDQNGVGYMLDIVTHTLYGNVGTGSFVVGEQLKNTIRLIEDEVPSIYERVNYLKSSGVQYIDTGVVAKSGLSSVLNFEYTALSDTASMLDARSGNNRFYLCHAGKPSTTFFFYYGYGSAVQSSTTPTVNTRYLVETSLTVGSQSMKVNGTTIASGSDSGTYNLGVNLYLFGMNYGTEQYLTSAKLYDCKIMDGSTLVRNYVPVVRKSDNKPGMYDRITKQFYVNQREGVADFTWG